MPGRRAEAQRYRREPATAIAEAIGTSDERRPSSAATRSEQNAINVAGMGEWNDTHALSLRDALWCWSGINPHACGGAQTSNARAVSAVGATTYTEARGAVDNFRGFYACYANAPTAAFVGAEG